MVCCCNITYKTVDRDRIKVRSPVTWSSVTIDFAPEIAFSQPHQGLNETPSRSSHIPSYRILYRAPYSLALVCACLRIGSSLVAFMTLPLILSLPDMNSLWALPLPVTRLSKSDSDKERVTVLSVSARAFSSV